MPIGRDLKPALSRSKGLLSETLRSRRVGWSPPSWAVPPAGSFLDEAWREEDNRSRVIGDCHFATNVELFSSATWIGGADSGA